MRVQGEYESCKVSKQSLSGGYQWGIKEGGGEQLIEDNNFHRSSIVMSWSWILTLLALLCVNAAHAGYALPVEKRAASHEHWEHIAKRSVEAARLDDSYEDDTAHIVNIQDYYRQVFHGGWEDYRDREQELVEELHYLQNAVDQGRKLTSSERIQIQEETARLNTYQKRIQGRYIVLFHPATDDYVLDRTVEILQKANRESNQRLRATDISTLRHIRKGFTATLNSKTVQLVGLHIHTA